MIKEYRWYIVFFFVLLAFVFFTGFNGLYGQDSYEYLRFTKCLSVYIKTGAAPGGFFWPLFYPLSGAIVSFIISPVFALQLVSIISFVVAAIYLDKTLTLLYNPDGRTKRAFTFLILLFSPYMLRASLVAMSDMLAVCCMTVSYYYCFKYRMFLKSRHFFWFVAFAMVAIATRYAAVVLLVVPGLSITTSLLKQFKWKAFVASACIAVLIALPQILYSHNNPLEFIHNEWLTQWSFANFFKNEFVTGGGNTHFAFYNIGYAFFNLVHPAFCFTGCIFLFIFLRWYKGTGYEHKWVIWLSVWLYSMFLAGIPFQNLRFLLLSFPLIAIMYFPPFVMLAKYFDARKKIKMIVIAGTALIQLGLFYRVFMPFYNDNKVEKQIATEMLKYPNTHIYTFSIDGALQAYGVTNKIINLYRVRLDTVKNIGGDMLVLFNEKQFSEEWKGQNPMINWEYLQKQYKLSRVESLPDGWELFRAE